MFWNLLWGNSVQAQSWANKERYAQANAELLATARENPLRVVLMGNSITEFVNNQLVCRGISGQVSSQMLARFRQDVISLKPRIVVINCGTNDIAENNGPYDEDITMDNIKSMTELARAHGIEVVLSSVLPCDSFCWNPAVRQVTDKISSLNRRILDYATSQHLLYIDYYSRMSTPRGGMIKGYTDDGVHPNPAGYDTMEPLLLDAIQQLEKNHCQ